MSYFTKASLLFAFILISSITVDAQENDSLLQKRIQNQQFVFVPLSVSSSSVTMSVLARDYKLEVTTDSVIANLPYFGNSNTPMFGRSYDDAIIFASTNFEYSAVAKKKGKWEITIEPKDTKGIRVFLTVFNNGDAQMDVTNPRKETMVFKGYVW